MNPEGKLGAHLEPGIPVDVQVALKPEDENQRKDTILEYALEYLR